MKGVNFLDPAKDEMADAAEYYEKQSSGLGSRFLQEVEFTIRQIGEFPSAGRKLSQRVRRRITRAFPFGVLYIEETEQIIIVAVMHQKRRPGYWKERLSIEKEARDINEKP